MTKEEALEWADKRYRIVRKEMPFGPMYAVQVKGWFFWNFIYWREGYRAPHWFFSRLTSHNTLSYEGAQARMSREIDQDASTLMRTFNNWEVIP